IPSNGNLVYLNNYGMKSSGDGFKAGYLDEVVIRIKDDTHILLEKTLRAVGDEKATNSDAYITGIYGIY
ncbi:DUF2479 domain-containing protein, partial [Staphylococcus pseudintermedius]|nr:DUF2479 domain-containing protein [Staphylococcus pseudintermedius]